MRTSVSIIIVISIFTFNSCSIHKYYREYIPQKCIDFAIDVSQNPEKAYNIKENYPEFYNEKHFHYKMKDSGNIKELIVTFCNEKFKGKKDKIKIQKMSSPSSKIESWNRYNTPIKYYYKDSDLLWFRLEMGNDTLEFLFVKEYCQYYIFRIFHGIIHAEM